ncbi:MAG: type ISP restriction/modification enzyme, partial [Betaproteobacteria bacterium]
QVLINKYLTELANLKKVGGTQRESVVREAFKDLLKQWGRTLDLTFIPEYELATRTRERRYADGALLHTLRVPFGYWEAKDSHDDLDVEIDKKLRAGYPRTNIVFEDTRCAVLIQHGEEVMRCDVEDVAQLEKLLRLFFAYERPEIEAFRRAVEQFKSDLPAVLAALRAMIERAERDTPAFRAAAAAFLVHAQEAINPSLTDADVREMLIQHVLTGELFAAVFPGTSYHEDNSVARELHKLEATFFTGNTRHQTLAGLAPYYTAIRKAAAEIATHHQKQTFLKAIYENFYKIYNPKAADRLGVVYTPNEIVRFMIEGADWLCEKHFGRSLIDPDVDILDPATGTGTFICELIEHFAGQPAKLRHKYRHELHANEVAILPYYVANLNLEATFAAATGSYEEFPGLCFVDTLDNTYALRKYRGHVDDLFGAVSDDNVRRIRQQNSRRISVVIGNPPYNANQLNENENNKNREYPEIDRRIKDTYIAASSAQKTKLYDMYARFLRWASDRVDENGIVAFVSNNSFIDSRTFDGFRKCAAEEFNEIRIVDLKGNARTSGERRRREGGNVFDDQIRVGVAVYFLVKRKAARGYRIFYEAVRDYAKAEEKRHFLQAARLAERKTSELRPDRKHNWLDAGESDFDLLLPVASKAAKAAAKPRDERAIFKLFSLGVSTNRDEWVYADDGKNALARASGLLANASAPKAAGEWDERIKWSESLKRRVAAGASEVAEADRLRQTAYRPFVRRWLYASDLLVDRPGDMRRIPRDCPTICFSIGKDFRVLACGSPFDLHFVGDTVGLPSAMLGTEKPYPPNVTDWAVQQFRARYPKAAWPSPEKRSRVERDVDTQDIFHYVYAVLHDPTYREKYALNLKREFPRIPFYADFWQWADWGRALMDAHVGYEAVDPYPLTRSDVPDERARRAGLAPKALLRANRDAGTLLLDSQTTLAGVPPAAWDYKLGNRSALEWVLDQYKEKTPRDPTIRERFDTYRFADYKERVIDLLARVTTVSVETMRIVGAMKSAARRR